MTKRAEGATRELSVSEHVHLRKKVTAGRPPRFGGGVRVYLDLSVADARYVQGALERVARELDRHVPDHPNFVDAFVATQTLHKVAERIGWALDAALADQRRSGKGGGA